jgi:hypothetical protein
VTEEKVLKVRLERSDSVCWRSDYGRLLKKQEEEVDTDVAGFGWMFRTSVCHMGKWKLIF